MCVLCCLLYLLLLLLWYVVGVDVVGFEYCCVGVVGFDWEFDVD